MGESSTEASGHRYAAFISYRHVEPDRTWAIWLHKALEAYQVPKKLRQDRSLPPKIGVVFRDEEELAASHNLSELIETALRESRFLIVVCSPRTPSSKWVNEEVKRFRELGRGNQILALLIEGEPKESFPELLREIRRRSIEKDGVTQEQLEEIEPLAADVRDTRQESRRTLRKTAKLRLLATILGCRFDELRQREQERQKRRLVFFSVLMSALFVGVSSLAGYAVYQKEQAEKQTRIATAQLVATHARNGLKDFPQRSLLLAVQALETTFKKGEPPVPLAEQALREALTYSGGRGLSGHTDAVVASTISPDGHWLVTGSWENDGTVRLWDLTAKDPGAAPKILQGHKGEVHVLAVSPDSRLLVTGGKDGTAQLWDLTAKGTEAKPARVFKTGKETIFTARFDRSNHCLVVGGSEKTLWIRELTSKSPEVPQVSFPVPSHGLSFDEQNSFVEASFSQDMQRLVALISYFPDISVVYETVVWDLTHPTAKPMIFPGGADSRAISPDNRWLVSANEVRGQGNIANLWDLRAANPTAKPLPLRGHGNFIRAAAFSPDSHWLLTGSWDESARLWNLMAKDPSKTDIVLKGSAEVLAFTPDNRWAVTAGAAKTAKLWDLAVDDPAQAPILLNGHEGGIRTTTVSPDSRWLVTGGWDGTARLWDLTATQQNAEPTILRGHTHEVASLAVSSTNRVASGSWGGAAIIWDLSAKFAGVAPVIIKQRIEYSLADVAVTPDGRWLITTDRGRNDGGDRKAYLWDLTAKAPSTQPLILNGHDGPISALTVSSDNHWVVTGSEDHTARLWDLKAPNPALAPIILKGHADPIRTVAMSADNRWVATGGWNATARLWDITTPDPSGSSIVLHGHEDIVHSVAFSNDSKWFVTGSKDKKVRLWDLTRIQTTTDPVAVLPHAQDITAVAISPDSRWVVAASSSKDALLVDLSAGLPARTKVLRRHLQGITGIAFSSNNRWLATVSMDNTACLWNLAAPDPEVEPIVLRGHEGGTDGSIWAVAFSPDNHWLITGGSDHTVRLWNLRLDELTTLARVTAGRSLKPEEIEQAYPRSVNDGLSVLGR